MPPTKRSAQEASIFDEPNPISKQKLAAQAQLAGRGRRANGLGTGGSGTTALAATSNGVHSSLKDLAAVSEAVRNHDGSNGSVRFPTLSWIELKIKRVLIVEQLDFWDGSRSLLLRYRDAYRLPTGTPFTNASAQHILASGIGPKSPTMVQERAKRRCTREEVAAVVKKHFKDTSVAENDCLIEVMYRVKMKGMHGTPFLHNCKG